MHNIKLALKLLFAVVGCIVAAGCTCVSFNPAGSEENGISFSGTKQYQIVNAETLMLSPMNKTEPLCALEFNMLARSLGNMPGNDFGSFWSNAAPEIDRARSYQSTLTSDTDAFKISCRSIAPNIFNSSSGAIKIQVKSVIVIRPEEISPWWMTGYLLTLSMAPMRSSSLGTVVVAVLDGNGNTIGSKVILFRRSYWISGFLPTALMCGGKYSCTKVDPDNQNGDEKALLNQITARAVMDILNINSVKAPAVSPEWINFRTAIVESIISGNEPAAVALLRDSYKKFIGGKECQDWLDLID
ncbi:MAG: hypothetical protein WCV67_17900 [Victivallaceae bacterium]|jgi:hypothetical protein